MELDKEIIYFRVQAGMQLYQSPTVPKYWVYIPMRVLRLFSEGHLRSLFFPPDHPRVGSYRQKHPTALQAFEVDQR